MVCTGNSVLGDSLVCGYSCDLWLILCLRQFTQQMFKGAVWCVIEDTYSEGWGNLSTPRFAVPSDFFPRNSCTHMKALKYRDTYLELKMSCFILPLKIRCSYCVIFFFNLTELHENFSFQLYSVIVGKKKLWRTGTTHLNWSIFLFMASKAQRIAYWISRRYPAGRGSKHYTGQNCKPKYSWQTERRALIRKTTVD